MVHRHKKHKPFGERPRRRRKQIYIRIKNDIRRAAPVLGGLFYTHDYLHGENGWVDCYFLGNGPLVVYNCALQTAKYAYKEAVSDAAWDAADKLVPRNYDLLSRSKKDPQTGLWVLEPEPETTHAEYGGLTRFQWLKEEERRIADAGCIQVFEEVTLHRDYACGIGLHATLNVEYLTADTINAFIRAFLAAGEKPYRNAAPLTFKHAEIAHWGLESNAIVEPWEYPKADGESKD